MQTVIKICGLSTREAISTSIHAGADMLGFIFFEKSPRHLEIEKATGLSDFIGSKIEKVAVTVNADQTYLDQIVKRVKPDILQLHGAETPEQVALAKQRYGIPVMKAFAIRTSEDFDKLIPFEGIADRFLLDAKAPEGAEIPGGNGISFDWNLLIKAKFKTPYMLSGGLEVGNIIDALKISGAAAIDISSGVESSPGVKDIAKINAFIKTVRGYDLSVEKNKDLAPVGLSH
ncbi:MAG: phosphoribosylanthranilate isomerase [Salaquimonas sp.]